MTPEQQKEFIQQLAALKEQVAKVQESVAESKANREARANANK